MTWTALEQEILAAVTEELAHDAAFNAEYGKRFENIRLECEFPATRIVIDVEERRPPLDLRWSPSYEIWDGSWDQEGSTTPWPGSVAALLSTDLMESSGAFIDCVARPGPDEDRRTRARLKVADFDGCSRFYVDGLGFCSSLRLRRDDPAELELELGSALFTLVAASPSTDVPEQEPPRRLYKAAVFLRVASVDTALESLRPWGAFVGKRNMTDDLYRRVLHVNDPDGNLVEVYDDSPYQPRDS